jgi:hypothetical protein
VLGWVDAIECDGRENQGGKWQKSGGDVSWVVKQRHRVVLRLSPPFLCLCFFLFVLPATSTSTSTSTSTTITQRCVCCCNSHHAGINLDLAYCLTIG